MPQSQYRLEDVLPHRPPMMLIDRIVECDTNDGTITVEAVIREEWTDSVSAIELMAQSAAALAGAADIASGHKGKAKPGFLLGTRKMELFLPAFKAGEICTVKARRIFNDAETASFECSVERSNGTTAATATLNAYRPPDIAAFLSEL